MNLLPALPKQVGQAAPAGLGYCYRPKPSMVLRWCLNSYWRGHLSRLAGMHIASADLPFGLIYGTHADELVLQFCSSSFRTARISAATAGVCSCQNIPLSEILVK